MPSRKSLEEQLSRLRHEQERAEADLRAQISANYLRILDAAEAVLEKRGICERIGRAMEKALSDLDPEFPVPVKSPNSDNLDNEAVNSPKLTQDLLWKIRWGRAEEHSCGLLAAWTKLNEATVANPSIRETAWMDEWRRLFLQESRQLLAGPITSFDDIRDALEILSRSEEEEEDDRRSKADILLNAQIPLIHSAMNMEDDRWLSMLTGLVRMMHEFMRKDGGNDWLSAPSRIVHSVADYACSDEPLLALRRLAQMLAWLTHETPSPSPSSSMDGEDVLEGLAERVVERIPRDPASIQESFRGASLLVEAFQPFPIDGRVMGRLSERFVQIARSHRMSLLFGMMPMPMSMTREALEDEAADLESVPPPRPLIAPMA